jgi:hypothetical protein
MILSQQNKLIIRYRFSFQLWLEHLSILSSHFHQFSSFNLFLWKPQVCKAKSRQTENVVKKSNGSEEIYERTEFSEFSNFSQIIEFSIHKKINEKIYGFSSNSHLNFPQKKGNRIFTVQKSSLMESSFYDFLVMIKFDCWWFSLILVSWPLSQKSLI